MNNSTPFDKEPSELTIHILRTIAHNFPAGNMSEAMRRVSFS